MNPKVISIFNNAMTFLSPEELKELALCIENEVGKPVKVKKKKKALVDLPSPEILAMRYLQKHRAKHKA
jgi:hypothetical protein